MSPIALLLALPIVLAGAWYVVNPHNVARLAELEGTPTNRTRRRLRRANGVVMILAGVALYFAVSRVLWLTAGEDRRPGLLLPLACIALVPLLVAMLTLAYADLRLTRRMKRQGIDKIVRDSRQRSPNGRGAVFVLAALVVVMAGCDEVPAPPAAPPPESPESSPPVLQGERPQSSSRVASTRPADPPAPVEEPQPQDLPTVELTLGGEPFEMMVANDDDERATGLMHRRELGANEGMIFVFPDRDWRGFWMRNTHVPLDILFLDEKARILNIEPAQPYSERSVRSAGRAKYVIEIPLGRARQLGLRRGDVVELPESARETDE